MSNSNRLHPAEDFVFGYNAITDLRQKHQEMRMDFGILKLNEGMVFEDDHPELERVYLLIYGKVEIEYDGNKVVAERGSYLNENIWCINTPQGVKLTVKGLAADSEIAVMRTENDKKFEPVVRCGEQIVNEIRGKGFMNEAGTRIVRTAQDVRLSPDSNLMLGEDVHYPGKWSGFPSHSHKQPEIYFYKFYPKNGFGLLKLGDDAVLLEHNDTVKIQPQLVHPQVAAPGYAMYYIWVIRHLEGNPYIKPDFEEQHLWVEQPGAKYWPDI